MRIHKFTGKNIFGYINQEITFDDDISILVGINGSGKTSTMQIINWMLSPDIDILSNIDFELIEIELEKENEKILINCIQNEENLVYTVTIGSNQMPPLKVNFKQIPKKNENLDLLRHRLAPEKDELETYLFVANLGKLKLIGIDRELNKQEKNMKIVVDKDYESLLEDEEKVPPMIAVQNIIKSQVNIYRKKVLDYNKQLRDKIIESVFTDVVVSPVNSWDELCSNLRLTETRFTTFIQKYTDGINSDLMSRYFTELLKGVTNYTENTPEEERSRLLDKYQRVVGVLKIFEDYEKKSNLAYNMLSEYLSELNKFMGDTGKEIVITESSLELSFNVFRGKKLIKKDGNIRNLSSGEKQLIILLTYITFSSENEVILIDEPEISLHPLWQENFMDALKNLLPKTTQIILATHSPALVGKNRKYCKIMSRGE